MKLHRFSDLPLGVPLQSARVVDVRIYGKQVAAVRVFVEVGAEWTFSILFAELDELPMPGDQLYVSVVRP